MRTLIDLDETLIRDLDEIAKAAKRSPRLADPRSDCGVSRQSPQGCRGRGLWPLGQTRGRRARLPEEAARRMVKALFDTNILIDYLNAVPKARAELARYDDKAISIVTWIEVLVGAPKDLENKTRAFLSALCPHRARRSGRRPRRPLAPSTSNQAARRRRLGLGAGARDAAGHARNTKDFPAGDPSVRCPYTL